MAQVVNVGDVVRIKRAATSHSKRDKVVAGRIDAGACQIQKPGREATVEIVGWRHDEQTLVVRFDAGECAPMWAVVSLNELEGEWHRETRARAAMACEAIKAGFVAGAIYHSAGAVECKPDKERAGVVWCVARWPMERAAKITLDARCDIRRRVEDAVAAGNFGFSVASDDDTPLQLGPAVAFRFELV